jgi:uncharacterized delta-60 repeat protein
MKPLYKTYLFFLIVLFLNSPSIFSQPSILWTAVYNGLFDSTDIAVDIAVDGTGNVYVTGYSSAGLSFSDYLTVKYSPNGTQLWERRYNGPGYLFDEAKSIAVDDYGNVYVTGYSYGLLSLSDFATIKYDQNGNLLWIQRYNGINNLFDEAVDVAIDDLGNIYVTGYSTSLLSLEDYVTIKYSSNGILQWIASYDGGLLSSDRAMGLVLDSDGNLAVTGWSKSNLLPGTEDYATIKYNGTSGNQLWLSRYNGPGNSVDRAYAITVDNEDNIIITGSSRSGLLIGSEDYATIKYNGTSGNQLWLSRYNGPGNSVDRAYAITVDNEDNIIVTGSSRSGLLIGSEDYATLKYNNLNGNTIWTTRFNGIANNTDIPHAIKADFMNNIIITGFSKNKNLLGGEDYLTIKYAKALTGINILGIGIPKQNILYSNYPNPFNPKTKIKFDIPIGTSQSVFLNIYDVLGKRITVLVDEQLNPGTYEVNWDASNYPCGIYFYELIAGEYTDTKKMILVK